MNITSNGKYPANKLSNFAGHRFVIDGVECYSMEGFLQSLKFKSPEMQVEVCKLIGSGAKKKGANKNWKRRQILYWQGKEYPRKSKEYQQLLDRAYQAMFDQSESFRKALKASMGSTLNHSIGKTKESDTVLTISEFCRRLTRLRDQL
jgi:hypothetical protein